MKKEGDLRVWHIPNPPKKPYRVSVKSLVEAKQVLDTLAFYDLYLGDDLVFANVQGLEVFEGEEWVEWHNEDGYDFREIMDGDDQHTPAVREEVR